MHNKRRQILIALSLCTAVIPAQAAQSKSSFPERALTIVVPFSAGGGSDVVARILATGMSAKLGQSVIVENKTGASGNIGAEAVAKAKPDGYTLLFGSMGVMSVNTHLYPNMSFQPEKDFTAIGRIYDTPHVIVVSPEFPATSLSDLISLAKSKPGSLTYASAGNGTSTHLMGALFMDQTKTKLTHVPYKGNAPALNDTMGGHVAIMFDQATNSTGQIRAKRLRALAVTSKNRLTDLPEVPTVGELGYPELEATSWTVLAAPADTPADIVEKLSQALEAALADADISEKIKQTGGLVNYESSAAANKLVKDESLRWGTLIKAANIATN
ncbi:Bug family tripartite tricarboxylate transporter substrate binding protein [Paracandidimonas soli]|uniref:Tripartite-type tricarboxylate transporter receptor subunit TctC n=1 Tax=Paracandidimonas soli TaxID=1917182 RepID=A0A4R3VH83_9BURK|nr:tripartite tricarboxylate transporter substrate binding protein [Paracandidimonas soli]TCV03118.1 tripartite-type tricarboxylate transporter receptor subunit TctC [Paracandidimonas soli]